MGEAREAGRMEGEGAGSEQGEAWERQNERECCWRDGTVIEGEGKAGVIQNGSGEKGR